MRTVIETPQVPKNWEDFCDKAIDISDEYYIGIASNIRSCAKLSYKTRRPNVDKNLTSTEQRAKAMLAFIQLIRVRDYVNGDWVPDWTDINHKYCIKMFDGNVSLENCRGYSNPLHFKTAEIRDQFLSNFKDLIEEAKEFI